MALQEQSRHSLLCFLGLGTSWNQTEPHGFVSHMNYQGGWAWVHHLHAGKCTTHQAKTSRTSFLRSTPKVVFKVAQDHQRRRTPPTEEITECIDIVRFDKRIFLQLVSGTAHCLRTSPWLRRTKTLPSSADRSALKKWILEERQNWSQCRFVLGDGAMDVGNGNGRTQRLS